MLGVYIHIPFCKEICNYCDFCKMYYNKKYALNYLDSLDREIKERYKGELIKSIYIGGGTPSVLDNCELERLLKLVEIFQKDDDYEYTIEGNIETITEEKLILLKKYGVNRISLGVQSFNKEIIDKLGRHHDKKMVFDVINLVKRYFDNINIDLIYGVNSDIGIVKKDINNFLELDIPHISCYSLILEKNTKMYLDKWEYIPEDIDSFMFDLINWTLKNHGYKHYEISNYAKDGYESIHNKNYWLNGDYYGFGLSAVSYLDCKRISNTKNMRKYLEGIYIDKSIYEDINIRKENDLILGLRLIEGIEIDRFNNKYNDNLLDKSIIRKLVDNNYLEVVNGKIRCKYKYIYLLNMILENIIGSDL